MGSNKRIARLAGLLYLIVVLTGIFNLLYVPSKIIVWDNAALTFNNIIASETLFRLGIIAGIICYTAFLILPFVLYRLLNQVNKTHAIGMVVLSVVSVPFSLVNLLNKVNVLTLINKPQYLQVWGSDKLQADVMLYLDSYNNGIQIVSVLGTMATAFWIPRIQIQLPSKNLRNFTNDWLSRLPYKFYWRFSFSKLFRLRY